MEAKGLEPSNLLTASQALYQLSYAPGIGFQATSPRQAIGLRSRGEPARTPGCLTGISRE